MSAADVAFVALGALAIVAGWRVFRTDSMVRASFFLLGSFLAVGAILLLLAAPYLGFAVLFMMAVEMLVMALFMVAFMMNPAGLNPMSMIHQPRIALAAGLATFALLATVALVADFPVASGPAPGDPIAGLGTELLGPSMLVFESAGVTILAAMVCAVVLSSRRGRHGRADEGSVPPPLVPGGEPAEPVVDALDGEDEDRQTGQAGDGGGHS